MDHGSLKPTRSPLPVLPTHQAYVCPGEDHPIPRSIHLARLAAYFPKCRDCVHRHDTGQLPRSTVGRLEQTAARVVQPSPFRAEGVRGEYLNHLNRQTAGRAAAALADRLWESQPLTGRVAVPDDEPDALSDQPARTSPVIVLGHDARPSSPDLCVGISAALRRMGCEVIDVGRVTGPCHRFAVEHLQTDAGLYVTGSGCPPQWTGLDLLGPRGLPWSLGAGNPEAGNPASRNARDRPAQSVISDDSDGMISLRNRVSEHCTLLDIERRFLAGVSRPTRQGGTQRYFDAAVPYRASLLKHFRDLRPLRLVAATADPVLLETLNSVFEPLACDLIPLADPVTSIDPLSPQERLAKQLRAIIKDTSAVCGVAIAEDAQGICLFDGQGSLSPPGLAMLRLVSRTRNPRHKAILVSDECDEFDVAQDQPLERVSGGREAMVSRLFDPETGPGLEPGGRLWVKDAVPTCDAVLTIGLLLCALSSSEKPLRSLIDTICPWHAGCHLERAR